jgi:hypothetical protein
VKADLQLRLFNTLRFVAGMSGLFSTFTALELDFLDLLCLLLAVAMSVICRFDLRYKGPQWLLWLFAANGLLVIAAATLASTGGALFLQGILRLALCALFCLLALHTRPAIEHRKTPA